MKAIVSTKYGPPDVLRLLEVEKPVPKDGEVLVKILAAAANPLDWHLLRGKPFLVRLMAGSLFKPKHTILGADVAGRVEAVGGNVKQFQPGDEVFGGKGVGGFAEYVCIPEDRLALKPTGLSFEDAAAVPVAAITALQGLRDKGRLQRGQKVLIEGASGGVGTFAVQIAKSFGADVTGVCSPGNLETALSLGADRVIDYTREDFTQDGQRYDLILGVNAHHSIFAYRRALAPKGIYVMVGGGRAQILQALFLGPILSMIGSQRTGALIVKRKQGDLASVKELLDAGKLAPVIDRRYPLSEVAEALRYLEEGHARGKIVLVPMAAEALSVANPMNRVQLHVAGATVRHQSPFSDLEVPVIYGPPPAEIIETWVRPLYFGLRQPQVEAFLATHLPRVGDELIHQLLSHFDWRPRSCGAYLAALTHRTAFADHLGRLLVRSDVCFAGKAYALALAALDEPAGNAYLEEYLDYYLQRIDLWFDQGEVMAALAYLDKKNGTDRLSRYLPLWHAFVADKKSWELGKSIAFFEENMDRLHALAAGRP
ncbi:MAG TPA: DUF6000 family protein [Thermoanaerobaculia bacterium]